VEKTFPGGWNFIRKAFLQQGVPEIGLKGIKASLSPSTLRQYTTYLNKWWVFCKNEKHNAFCYTLETVMSFLSVQFETGSSYSTLNSLYSAIALIFAVGDSDKIVLKRFLRGVYKQRPSRPRYQTIWDPQPVLSYLSKFHPLSDITKTQLTMKLVTLLALITGHRIQTIASIRIQNINRFPDILEIRITNQIKISSPKNFQPLLVIPYFQDHPDLCLASVIDFYENCTKDARCSANTDLLILTIKKPIHPASSQRISKWIKIILSASGTILTFFQVTVFVMPLLPLPIGQGSQLI